MTLILVLIYMIAIPVTVIVMLYKILCELEELSEKKETTTRTIRKHATIEKSNYDNAFGGRKAYEIYKNNSGLYEPQTPSKGIKIEKEA